MLTLINNKTFLVTEKRFDDWQETFEILTLIMQDLNVKLSHMYRVSVFLIPTMWQALLNVLRIFTLLFLLANANVSRTRLDKFKLTILPDFRFVSNRMCFKIQNCNFLLSQLQSTVILLLPLPLNPENLSLFLLYRLKFFFIASPKTIN